MLLSATSQLLKSSMVSINTGNNTLLFLEEIMEVQQKKLKGTSSGRSPKPIQLEVERAFH